MEGIVRGGIKCRVLISSLGIGRRLIFRLMRRHCHRDMVNEFNELRGLCTMFRLYIYLYDKVNRYIFLYLMCRINTSFSKETNYPLKNKVDQYCTSCI